MRRIVNSSTVRLLYSPLLSVPMKTYALVMFLLLCGCLGQGNGYRHETKDVFEKQMGEGTTAVDFETYNGKIGIHSWEKGSYRIEVHKWASASSKDKAEKKAENIEVAVREEGNSLICHIDYSKMPKDIVNSGADIDAYIPQKAYNAIMLQTFNGEIGADGVEASHIIIKTVNGNIEARLNAKVIEVETLNGEVRGTFSGADVNVQTFNGEIDVEFEGGGRYNARTSNGKITILTKADFGFDMETDIGSVIVKAGDVTYTLEEKRHKKGYTSPQFDIFIKASTSNGSIEVVKG
jgi:DUF4097 and DUF4098 domain-containing protein YvlB